MDVFEAIDRVNDAVSHPDFDSTIRNGWFLGISAVVVIACLLRGKKVLVTLYIGAIVVWGIASRTVLARSASGGDASSGLFPFIALIGAVALVVIYLLLIRD
jgi:hypothetical protein